MVPVPCPSIGRKTRNNHVGAELRSQRKEFAQNEFAIPHLKRLFWVFAESKVRRRGKKLLSAVDFSGFAQFRFANYAQGGSQFGADQILSALATRQTDVGHLAPLGPGPVGNETRVFVVGMRGNVEYSLYRLRTRSRGQARRQRKR